LRVKLETGRRESWASVISLSACPGLFDEFIKRRESIKQPFMGQWFRWETSVRINTDNLKTKKV